MTILTNPVLGDPLAPITRGDLQRVVGMRWLHERDGRFYATVAERYGTPTYAPKEYVSNGVRVPMRTHFVLPQVGTYPAYVGDGCTLCKHRVRRIAGGCEPGESSCRPAAREQAERHFEALKQKTTWSRGDETRARTPRPAWPDAVPLLCGSFALWETALADKKGPVSKAWYLDPDKAYHVHTIPKADGKKRRLHVPCGALMELQSRALERTLNRCAWPRHVAAYVPGRQLVDTAREHAGKALVITIDLKNFFGSTTYTMVYDALIETYGYAAFGAGPIDKERNAAGLAERLKLLEVLPLRSPNGITSLAESAVVYLTKLVTCPVRLDDPKSPRVLPQGAPTSGAFANLVGVHRLDPSILKLCEAHGFTYSRYADDLIFSREQDLSREETAAFIDAIAKAIASTGYRVNWKKLRVQRAHQQQRVLGLVVNDGTPRVPRTTRKTLRAQHHFLARNGADAAAERNDIHDETDGLPRAERFRHRHMGQIAYVRHVHADHVRSILHLSEMQWNGGA